MVQLSLIFNSKLYICCKKPLTKLYNNNKVNRTFILILKQLEINFKIISNLNNKNPFKIKGKVQVKVTVIKVNKYINLTNITAGKKKE